jgi:hypothetical protein
MERAEKEDFEKNKGRYEKTKKDRLAFIGKHRLDLRKDFKGATKERDCLVKAEEDYEENKKKLQEKMAS